MSHPLVLFDELPDLTPPTINAAAFNDATIHDELLRQLSTLAGWE
jgi:hypothetical protein